MMRKRCIPAFLLMSLFGVTATQASGPNDAARKADALFREGHFVDAERAYRATLTTDDANGQATLRLGEIALFGNRFDDAEHHLKRAMKLRPEDKRPKSLLAELYYRQDKFAQAVDLLRKLGRTEDADRLETFKGKTPYETRSDKDVTRVEFVQTDPLPIIKARINGGEEIHLLIDTGAAELVLDPEFATSVGAVRFGSTTGVFAGGKEASVGRATIDSVQLGEFLIRNVPVRLMPTRRLPFAVGGERIGGILGTVLMYHFISTLDYPAGELVLRRKTDGGGEDLRNHLASGQTHVVPFWMSGQHFIVAEGEVNGKAKCLMHVDTGMAGGGFDCHESVRKAAGIDLEGLPTFQGMGGGGPVTVTPCTVKDVALGDVSRADVQALFGALSPEFEYKSGYRIGGLVSHGFFRPFALTFDFDRMKLYLTSPE